VDDGVGAVLAEPVLEELVVAGKVEEVEADAPARLLAPDAGALLDRVHGRERLYAKLRVDPTPRQVIEDVDLVARVGQVERGRPADEAVAPQNRDLHGCVPPRPRPMRACSGVM
jgi:hypothetical protein